MKALLVKFVSKDMMSFQEREGLKQFMLMTRINPPTSGCWMLRDGKVLEIKEALSELGLYSCLMLENNNLILNENFGTLMRTKASHSNEGGVNTGFSVIDSPVLFQA